MLWLCILAPTTYKAVMVYVVYSRWLEKTLLIGALQPAVDTSTVSIPLLCTVSMNVSMNLARQLPWSPQSTNRAYRDQQQQIISLLATKSVAATIAVANEVTKDEAKERVQPKRVLSLLFTSQFLCIFKLLRQTQ